MEYGRRQPVWPSSPAEVNAATGSGRSKVCPVVGIGGSAGSLDVFKEFLRCTPPDTGLAFVAIQHLAPDRESLLAPLLARCTKMPVAEAKDRMPIERNHVYVIAPGTELTMSDGELLVSGHVRGWRGAHRSTPFSSPWRKPVAGTPSAFCSRAAATMARLGCAR